MFPRGTAQRAIAIMGCVHAKNIVADLQEICNLKLESPNFVSLSFLWLWLGVRLGFLVKD